MYASLEVVSLLRCKTCILFIQYSWEMKITRAMKKAFCVKQ